MRGKVYVKQTVIHLYSVKWIQSAGDYRGKQVTLSSTEAEHVKHASRILAIRFK